MKVKRLISIFVVVALLTSIVVFPVSASSAEYESNIYNYFDLMEAPVNYSLMGSSNSVSFALPREMYIRYVDLIIGTGYEFSSVKFKRGSDVDDMTILPVGNGVYRVYGEFGGGNSAWSDTVSFIFEFEERLDVQFWSFNFSISPYEYWGDVGTASVTTLEVNNTITETMPNKNTPVLVRIPSTVEHSKYIADFWCDNWRKYDYLDFLIVIEASGVNSISVGFEGGISIPFTLSYLNSSGVGNLEITEDRFQDIYVGDSYYTFPNGLDFDMIRVHLDLTKVNKTIAEDPIISISGPVAPTSLRLEDYYCSLISVSCTILVDNLSPLSIWFTNLIDSISSFSSEFSAKMVTLFSKIGTGFNNVISTLGEKIDTFASDFSARMVTLYNKLGTGFQSVVAAITGDGSAADEAGQAMEEAGNDLNNIGGAFDQVETPDIDAAALTGDFTNFSPSGLTVLATITNNSYVTSLLALVFTFALCAYIFFGRKR